MPLALSLTVPGPLIISDTWFCVAPCCTLIANAGSATRLRPSLTRMRISVYWPTWFAPGVPERRPVAELNAAQTGRLTTLNLSVWPSGSDAVGLNQYLLPATTDAFGSPEITGALFDVPASATDAIGSIAAKNMTAAKFRRVIRKLELIWNTPTILCRVTVLSLMPQTACHACNGVQAKVATPLSWPRGRQTGGFAFPRFDGIALFHFRHHYLRGDVCGQVGYVAVSRHCVSLADAHRDTSRD